MRKITALLLTLFLLLSVNITAFAQEVTVNTSVPDNHTLTVIAEHAQVLYHGKSGESFEIPRLSEPTLLICPENGYKVSKVTLNGEDITASVIGGYYTLAPVYEEKELIVETAAVPIKSNNIHDISGTVTDEDGSPVCGAAVDIGGKTYVTDKDGRFEIKDVPDGYHPVTITDKDGNIIGYTELEISEGDLKIIQNPNGTYTVTAPKNSAIYMELTVKRDGRTEIGSIKNVTPTHPGNLISPKTGDFSNINLWFSLMADSSGTLFFMILMNRRKKKAEEQD